MYVNENDERVSCQIAKYMVVDNVQYAFEIIRAMKINDHVFFEDRGDWGRCKIYAKDKQMNRFEVKDLSKGETKCIDADTFKEKYLLETEDESMERFAGNFWAVWTERDSWHFSKEHFYELIMFRFQE